MLLSRVWSAVHVAVTPPVVASCALLLAHHFSATLFHGGDLIAIARYLLVTTASCCKYLVREHTSSYRERVISEVCRERAAIKSGRARRGLQTPK